MKLVFFSLHALHCVFDSIHGVSYETPSR